MNKIQTLIVDDEPLARDVIRVMLQKHSNVEIVGECATGLEAVESILAEKPELVFLDIQMPDLDGFGVIREVGIDSMPVTVFVTAFDQYAIRAFETHALDYLLKPFDEERFTQSLRRAAALIGGKRQNHLSQDLVDLIADKFSASRSRPERLVIREAGRIFFVDLQEIDWIEAAGDYAKLHIGQKSHLLQRSMKALEAELHPRQFVRIHRSAIVNMSRVKEMRPHSNGDFFVYLKNDTRLRLSRSYRANFNKWLDNA